MQIAGSLVHTDDHVLEHLVLATNKESASLLRTDDAVGVTRPCLGAQKRAFIALGDHPDAGFVGIELCIQDHGAFRGGQQRRADANHSCCCSYREKVDR